jgi:ParB family chromosome partitioning protein
MKRKALGKGLESIIKNQPLQSSKDLLEIEIDEIKPNPFQPRKAFDEEKIGELAKSIDESGLIQPVVVFKKDNQYYLAVGERRWRAFRYLKRKTIPAYVREYNKNELLVQGLVENVQREDLNAIEVAEGLSHLIKASGLTQEKVAEKVGMKRVTLTNYLRLLHLPHPVKKAVAGEEISPGHARALLSLRSPERIIQGCRRIKSQSLSVRQAEKLVRELLKDEKKSRTKMDEERDPDVVRMEERLARYLSTKVNLQYSKGKGRVEIYFNQLEEFERIYQILLKGDQG